MADFNEIIHTRRSIRKFSEKSIEKEKINNILKAALLAPSGKGRYPAEFIVVDDKQILKAIASSKTHGAAFIRDAPLAIVVAADTNKYDIWIEDSAIAAAYIMLAAENEGLGSCWVQMRLRGTEDGKTVTENLSETLNLKPGFEVLSVIAIGYKAEDKEPHTEEHADFGRVHKNRFGQVYEP